MYRSSIDDLDNSLARLDAILRLLSYLHETASPADRFAQREGEEALVETLLAENSRARRAQRLLQRQMAPEHHPPGAGHPEGTERKQNGPVSYET